MKHSAVKILIAVNVAVYLLQSMSKGAIESLFALWPLQPLDGPGHGRRLAGARHTKQDDIARPRLEGLDDLVNGVRLVARGLKFRNHAERRHAPTSVPF